MEPIKTKYRIPLQGEYNEGIYDCPECGYQSENVVEDAIGFADSNIGNVLIWECPKCFLKWYFHSHWEEMGKNFYYGMFLNAIDEGKQKHYKEGD